MLEPTPGLVTLKQLHQEMQGVRSKTSEEQLAEIKATLEAQRQRLDRKRFKTPDLFKDSAAAFQLRNRFQQALNRLDNSETRERAVHDLRNLIEKNRSEEALKVIIGSLSEFKKSKSPRAREQEAALIGYLAEVYGLKLADSTIGPMHYLMKVMEIVQSLFSDMHRNVQEAAATSLCSLYHHSLPKDDLRLIFDVMYDPLYALLLSGVDVKAQQGAALALFKWVQTLAETNQVAIQKELTPHILQLFVRLRPEYPDLISALGVLSESTGFQDFVPELSPLLTKLVQYLKSRSHLSFSMKVEACKLLKLLGQKMQKVLDIVIGFSASEVIEALLDAKSDKVPVVQASAREALEQWQLLARMQNKAEEEKMQMETLMGDELIKHRTGLTELPRLVKERTATLELPSMLNRPPTEKFIDYKSVRELAKRRKETKSQSPGTTPGTNWGVMKGKFLLKGTGNYTSIPVGVTETRKYEPILSGNLMQPYLPFSTNESTGAVNKDLLKAIIRSRPQTRPPVASAQRLASQVKETTDFAGKAVEESVERIGNKLREVEERVDSTENAVKKLKAEPKNNESAQEPMIPDKEREKSPLPKDSVTKVWLKALESYSQSDLNAAYNTLLEAGDDVYLMRLLHKTGVCLDKLEKGVAERLMTRLGQLLGGFIITDSVLQWCSESVRLGTWSQLDLGTREQIAIDAKAASVLPDSVGEEAQTLLASIESL